jgi:hypothetical protein
MTTISAKTILRSRHAQRPDKVLSTLLLRYPRPIHAEFMTHRVMSRNAASSRAIPVAKLIQDVIDDPFVPLHWGANQKGMQADQECDAAISNWTQWGMGPVLTNERAWLLARDAAVAAASAFSKAGYHKQIVNRILEPYAHITVVVSSTEWSNFLALRDHKDAEPHIQILAREVRKELDREDNIQTLEPGEWHLPFVDEGDFYGTQKGKFIDFEEALQLAIKKSVACCASTSYKTVDGFDMTLEKAIELHDKLVGSAPLHASPAEHVAQADEWEVYADLTGKVGWQNDIQHGNFEGFRQYRKMLPNECL